MTKDKYPNKEGLAEIAVDPDVLAKSLRGFDEETINTHCYHFYFLWIK